MIYHVEKRPSEEGRSVLVRTEEGVDVIGRDFNCRTSVHEVRGITLHSLWAGCIYVVLASTVAQQLLCMTESHTSLMLKTDECIR